MSELLTQFNLNPSQLKLHNNNLLLEHLHFFDSINEFVGVVSKDKNTKYLLSWDTNGKLITDISESNKEDYNLILSKQKYYLAIFYDLTTKEYMPGHKLYSNDNIDYSLSSNPSFVKFIKVQM